MKRPTRSRLCYERLEARIALAGLDFGDALGDYPRSLAQNGARHFISGPRLGDLVDAEEDGTTSSGAGADDLSIGADRLDDEDGVQFLTPLRTNGTDSTTVEVEVNLQNADTAKLDAWLDLNRDQDWLDDGEQIFLSSELVAGDNRLTFELPPHSASGPTFIRFRVSSSGGLPPNGPADDGEVEDYPIAILKDPVIELAPLLAENGGDGSIGWNLLGGQQLESLGASVAGIGDFNGDGYGDVVIGAPNGLHEDNELGAAYVVFGQADGTFAEVSVDELSGENGFRIRSGSKDVWITDVARAGDVNGDGLDDILIRAGNASHVVFGAPGPFGSLLRLDSLNGSEGFHIEIPGAPTTPAGDVNGDGFADVLVTQAARLADVELDTVNVIYGRAEFPALVDKSSLDGTGGFIINKQVSGIDHRAGPAGDVNDDGFDDILMSGTRFPGEALLWFGAAESEANVSTAALNGVNGVKLIGGPQLFCGPNFIPVFPDRPADVNGDGVADLVVVRSVGYCSDRGQPLDKELSLDVVYGTSGAWPAEIQLSEIPDQLGYSLGYTSLRDLASATVSGDVDGDGVDEFLVSSTDTASDQWPLAGRANLLFGGQLAASVDDFERLLDETNSVAVVGVNDDVGIRWAVSAGDLNGDGLADQAIAAPSATANEEDRAGRVFLLYGQDYRQSISHRGDSADNILVGDGSANQLVGGPGDDTLEGAGGADVVYGGAGDDVIAISDATFKRIDGGTGRDTLRVDGAGVTLDLTAMGDHKFQNVEVIDLDGGGSNSLRLDPREVLRSSGSSNTLIVHRGNDDSVERGSNWTYEGLHRLAGEVYQRFTHGAALLMVEPAAAWRNPVDSLDVNNDGVVAPGDVLRIVNEINSQAVSDTTGRLPSVDSLTDLGISYYDANGDDHVTPADVRRIVNHFNAGEPSPEGEHPSAGRSLLATLFVDLSQAVGAQLTDDARIGSPARNRNHAVNLNEPLIRANQIQLFSSHRPLPIVDAVRGRLSVFVDPPYDLEALDLALEELLDEMACELLPLKQ